jgi:membrane-bound lytic murein transglycosylase F
MIPNTYDAMIKAAAGQYLPGVDWRWYKAQLFQESELKPTAKSHRGARGLAQFMPGTWEEVAEQLGFPPNASPHNPVLAMHAGAHYMARQLRGWTTPRPEMDRYCLALASYNAGFGNILDAQEVAGDANAYSDIIAALHLVTGDDNAHETRTYVTRIWHYYGELVTG